MLNLKRSLARLSLAVCTLVIMASADYGAAAQAPTATRTPITLQAISRESFLSRVQLSPDGAHMAALSSLDGENTQIAIWRTDNLSQNPVRFGVGGASARAQVRFSGFTWLSNDRLLVYMNQPVTTGQGQSNRNYTTMARIVDITGRRWVEPLARGGRQSELEAFVNQLTTISLLDTLPNDPGHVLVLQWSLDGEAIYRMDVNTGQGERVARVSEIESVAPIVDPNGNVRVKQFARNRGGEWIIGYEVFNTSNNQWEEHPALSYTARSRRNLSVIHFDPANPDLLIVLDDEGQNFTYVRGYSISQRAFVENLFQDPEHDIANVLIERPDAGQPTRVVGFTYLADSERPYYVDPTYRALHEGLLRQLPGRNISIGQRRGRYRIITATSSIHPPSYYLMTNDQQLEVLGSSNPDIQSNTLAATQLIHYPARDGLEIPAFLTLPYGWTPAQGPLPVIIQPHGGPWSRNNANWGGGDIPVTQYFASRGFAVLQPQFRGSTGWGNRLWRAGDAQWGLAMQDDKDDGLAYLVRQGVADPQRAIIYGFSYGGFAAMAAAVRPNSPYRCAISGAGVSSLQRLGTLWSRNRIQRQLQGTTVAGFDPLEHASDANIPILIYHGDRDQTATLWHSERFAEALRGAGKPHEFAVIPEMPHGAVTPDMQRQELTLVENYIRNTCGISY